MAAKRKNGQKIELTRSSPGPFNCIRLCHFPEYWKEAKVITLPKPGEDRKFP
jgi:hypothetical protein